jgi:integrase
VDALTFRSTARLVRKRRISSPPSALGWFMPWNSALLFLYKAVLGQDPGWLDGIGRAKGPRRLPVVLTREEVRAVLTKVDGTAQLVATLLYGTGMRLLEALTLRVKDVDFGHGVMPNPLDRLIRCGSDPVRTGRDRGCRGRFL